MSNHQITAIPSAEQALQSILANHQAQGQAAQLAGNSSLANLHSNAKDVAFALAALVRPDAQLNASAATLLDRMIIKTVQDHPDATYGDCAGAIPFELAAMATFVNRYRSV